MFLKANVLMADIKKSKRLSCKSTTYKVLLFNLHNH